MTLKQQLYFGLAMLGIAITLVILAALSLPKQPWQFSLSPTGQLIAHLPGQTTQAVDYFLIDQKPLPANPNLALEEPDTVASYADFNQLMADSSQLLQALNKQQLAMQLANQEIVALQAQKRSINDLSGLFWLQITCGSLGFIICLLIKAARPKHPSINAFALTGLSYMLFTFAASIYSTRNLFIDGQLFHILSLLNHAGAMLFTAALTVFLWNYPKAIGKRAIAWLAYGMFAANIVVDGLQLTHGPDTGSYLWVFSLFLLALYGSFVQWWFARKNPVDKGAVRWLLLSIYAGTVFFAGGMMLPILLNIEPVASQALMFTTFLLMYGGLALGVLRYRLFDLERWWFAIWAWFLGGVAIIIMDILLASFLTLSNTATITLATAIVGWLYFPIRQWCWQKISARRGFMLEQWLAPAVAELISVKTPLQLEQAWQNRLNSLLQPLMLEQTNQKISSITIKQNGLQLQVPTITQGGSLLINNPNQGQRLFTRNDSRNVQTLLTLFQLVGNALKAKTEGASIERDRIRQDIHDDLGAKLLSILHSSQEEKPQKLAKEALADLKNLLQSIEIQPIDLPYALDLWQQEARERMPKGVQLIWHEPSNAILKELPAEHFAHLTRAVRECLSNALRHANASKITVAISLDSNNLTISIVNDGATDGQKTNVSGRGRNILQQRLESLGGQCSCEQQGNSWKVTLQAPLP